MPGQTLTFHADMITEQAARSFYRVDLTELRQDRIAVGGCDDPLIVVERRGTLDGKPTDIGTMWLGPTFGWRRK